MSTAVCPVCQSTRLEDAYPDHEGACITSDMMVLPASSLKNCLCTGCGLIFNREGTRGKTTAFYRNSYSLMMTNPGAAIQSFAGPQPMSQAERTYQILRELVALPRSGRVLEAGAGKGEFLGHFTTGLPDWKVSAFEPSEAYQQLREKFADRPVERCEYRDWPIGQRAFDLLIALGVLEHVENPLDMLRWGNKLLEDGGIFFIRVPNFAKNPNDLFCADHLSKLTGAMLSNLAGATGFETIGVKEAGVPIFVALRKTGAPQARLGNAAEANRPVLKANIAVASKTMNAVLRAREVSQSKGERFAVFGLGPAGLFAPLFAGFPASEIAAYVDENRSVWGGQIHGRPIGGLDLIEKESIRHIALSISPVYTEQVSAKLRPLGVEIYAA